MSYPYVLMYFGGIIILGNINEFNNVVFPEHLFPIIVIVILLGFSFNFLYYLI